MSEVNRIISNAIMYCSDLPNENKTYSDILKELKTQDNLVHSRFRNSVAKEINNYITDYYGSLIKEVRLYGSTMEFNAGKYSDIDIIIRVERSGGEILESIKRLDRLLTVEYYCLIQERPDSYTYLIDPHIIDDDSLIQPDPSKAYLEYIMKNESVAIS